MGDAPKVEFLLGSEVSVGQFFKSSFARAFVTHSRDSKSLDYQPLDNANSDEPKLNGNNGNNGNNNYFSLVNFGNGTTTPNSRFSGKGNANVWKQIEVIKSPSSINELEKLQKQYQSLIDENRRLQDALTLNRTPHTQVIDNIVLQTEIETLQWQLKQVDANRQMYRSLMEQVVRFLDRTRKSLDILHEKNSLKDKGSAGRVPRSRSVHAVHDESSPNRGASTTSSSSSSSDSSRFARAKSVTQISPCTTGHRDFTWSVLRRNDPVHCTPPRNKSNDLNKSHDAVAYKRPKQQEMNPNDVPPQKLSQEAFRLMRTVQSLLSMREPDLTRYTPVDNTESSPSPVDHGRHNSHNSHNNEVSLSLQNNSFVNSTTVQEAVSYARRRSCDHGNESRGVESDGRTCFMKSLSHAAETERSLQSLLPGVRMSIDATSLNSGSSKTTEEEDALLAHSSINVSLPENVNAFMFTPTSTPIKSIRKIEKKEKEKYSKSKPAASVSSVEDESGFSSMSSFQEIGLPGVLQISPIKGCHTEIGLPEIPVDKARHRRWSSTPAELKSLLKQHRRSFATSQTNTESLSVWV